MYMYCPGQILKQVLNVKYGINILKIKTNRGKMWIVWIGFKKAMLQDNIWINLEGSWAPYTKSQVLLSAPLKPKVLVFLSVNERPWLVTAEAWLKLCMWKWQQTSERKKKWFKTLPKYSQSPEIVYLKTQKIINPSFFSIVWKIR